MLSVVLEWHETQVMFRCGAWSNWLWANQRRGDEGMPVGTVWSTGDAPAACAGGCDGGDASRGTVPWTLWQSVHLLDAM